MFCISAIRLVRPAQLPKADQLERKIQAAEKLGSYALLNLAKTATRLEVVDALHAAKAPYQPEAALLAALPDDVQAFMQAMVRRLDAAALEVLATLPEVSALASASKARAA